MDNLLLPQVMNISENLIYILSICSNTTERNIGLYPLKIHSLDIYVWKTQSERGANAVFYLINFRAKNYRIWH